VIYFCLLFAKRLGFFSKVRRTELALLDCTQALGTLGVASQRIDILVLVVLLQPQSNFLRSLC